MSGELLTNQNQSVPILEFALLQQTVANMGKLADKMDIKIGELEKADAVTQSQLAIVFSNLGDIKDSQKSILDKLEKKELEDKEALKDTIKQNKELKKLVIGAVITTLIGNILPMFLK